MSFTVLGHAPRIFAVRILARHRTATEGGKRATVRPSVCLLDSQRRGSRGGISARRICVRRIITAARRDATRLAASGDSADGLCRRSPCWTFPCFIRASSGRRASRRRTFLRFREAGRDEDERSVGVALPASLLPSACCQNQLPLLTLALLLFLYFRSPCQPPRSRDHVGDLAYARDPPERSATFADSSPICGFLALSWSLEKKYSRR